MSIPEIFDSSLVRAVGWALLHLTWQATLVALVLAAALRALRSQAAAIRYVMACGALVLVTALPVITIWNTYQSQSKLDGAGSAQSSGGTPTDSFPLLESHPATSAVTGSAPALSSFQIEQHLPLLVGLWLLGVFCCSGRVVAAWLKLRRMALLSGPASPEWQHALARLTWRIRISRPVRLLQSAVVEVPTVIGWLRPVVLLPFSALTGLTRQQLETILAHELAHIRRHDFIVNLYQTAVETLLFYHPAVWWISSQIRIEREHCCDDLAVGLCGNPLLYARALADLEQTRWPAAAPALALSGGSLLHRVRRVVGGSPRQCSAQWLAGVSVLTVIAALVIAAPLSLLAIADEPRAQQAPRAAAAAKPAEDSITVTAATAGPEEPEAEERGAISRRATSFATTPRSSLFAPRAAIAVSDAVAAQPPTPVVAPQIPVRTPRPARPIVVTPEPDELDFDFDYDFDFAFDFDYELDFPDELEAPTPKPGKPHKGKKDKPLNRSALTVDDLIHLKAIDVTPEFIDELGRAGYKELTLNEIAMLKHAGITAADVSRLRSMGLVDLSVRDLVRLRHAGVTPEFVRSLRDAGLTNLTVHEILKLRHAGVDGDFVRKMKKQ